MGWLVLRTLRLRQGPNPLLATEQPGELALAERSTQCWPQQPSTAGPNRTCLIRSPDDGPPTSDKYALSAAAVCIRAVARRAGVPVREACQDLARSTGRPAITTSSGRSRSGHLTVRRPIITADTCALPQISAGYKL